MTLTLASAVSLTDTVTVEYTQPTTQSRIKDLAGNPAPSFDHGDFTVDVTSGPPKISIVTNNDNELEGTALSFTVSRTGATTAALDVTVNVEQTEGDVIAASNTGDRTVTIASGDASKTFTIATINDSVGEDDGFVKVTIKSVPSGNVIDVDANLGHGAGDGLEGPARQDQAREEDGDGQGERGQGRNRGGDHHGGGPEAAGGSGDRGVLGFDAGWCRGEPRGLHQRHQRGSIGGERLLAGERALDGADDDRRPDRPQPRGPLGGPGRRAAGRQSQRPVGD